MAGANESDIISVLRLIKRWYTGGAEGTKKFTLDAGDDVTYHLSVWKTADELISLNMKNAKTKKSEFSLTKRGLIDEDYEYIGGCIMEVLGMVGDETPDDVYHGESVK